MKDLTFRFTNNQLYVYGITDFTMDKFNCYSWYKGIDDSIVFPCSDGYTLFGILRQFEIITPDWKSIEVEVMR